MNKMAEKDKSKERKEDNLPPLSYDWNLLGNAAVAFDYLKRGKEGVPYVQKSLEYILKDANIKDPWIVQTVTDPEVLRKTIANQLSTYNQFKEKQTIGDLITYYNDDLTKYLGDNFENANKELSGFSNLKMSEILREIDEANYIIKGGKLGKSTKEQVEEAEKIAEKYEKITNTFEILQSLRYGKFRTRVEEGVATEALNQMYSTNQEAEEGDKK
jgi:hypothetical protein